jgi:hypothetical protein
MATPAVWGLAGRYRIRRKLEPEVVCEELHISVSGNVLEATSDDYDGGRYKATPGRPTSGNACLSVGLSPSPIADRLDLTPAWRFAT